MQGRRQAQELGEEGAGSNISKFSLLGQQLTDFSPSNHHHHHHHRQLIPSPEHLGVPHGSPQPSPLTTYCFSPPMNTPTPLAPGQALSHLSHNAVLPNGFQMVSFAATQSLKPQISSEFATAPQEDILKPITPGSPPVAVGPSVSPSVVGAINLLQQKVSQLHSLIQLIIECGQEGNSSFCRQQVSTAAGVATFISQLAQTTAGMLQFPQQQHQPSGQAFSELVRLVNMPAVASGLHLLHKNRFFVQQNGSGSSGEQLGAGMGLESVPFSASATPIENAKYNQSVTNIPTSQVNSTILSNYHLPSKENLTGEANRNAAAKSCRDGNASSAFGEVSEVLGGSGAATSKAANINSEDLDSGGGSRDEEDDADAEPEHLSPGSYTLVEMDAGEILAEHTHFCEMCGKGFKRDANLRMHMRGHGDEYKTPAALARPERSEDHSGLKLRRYSCPFGGCKRNKNHRKFVPLKTVLCVKNHYRRSHCPKLLTCSKCRSKKFSVVADLKTHEKHCGCDKWLCSCGTTFSRKDKLLGHIGLFHGHMPETLIQDMNGSATAAGRAVAAAAVINGASDGLVGHRKPEERSENCTD